MSSAVQGDDESLYPSISPDGSYVAFISYATNLVEGDTNGIYDVFRKEVTAPTPAPTIFSITPTYGVKSMLVDITNLAGTGFKAGAAVQIQRASTTISATDVAVVSSSQITCMLNLSGAPRGKYDLVVKNPDDQQATLTQGFTVTDICGEGAAISLSVFGIMKGMMSLAGSAGIRRRFRRKKT